jgi:hypothetical protein
MARLRRSAKQIARDTSGRRRSANQLWLTVGIAVIALVAILLFRQSCAKRMGKFYESLNPPGQTHKAGRRPPAMEPEPAPMQAPTARPEAPSTRPAPAARPPTSARPAGPMTEDPKGRK